MPEYDMYGGTSPVTDPTIQAQRDKMVEKMSAARAAGANWDQIHSAIGAKIQAARDAGAHDDQIAHAMGYNTQAELIHGMQMDIGENAAAQKPESLWDAAVGGITESASAAAINLATGGKVAKPQAQPQGEGRPQQIIRAIGMTAGDLPVAIPAGIAGAAVGVAGGAGAGGGPEDVPADIGGGYIGATTFAGGAPQLLRSERDRYLSALNSGQVRNGWDFLKIQGQVAVDTAQSALVSAATGAVGKLVHFNLGRMGANRATRILGTVGAETVTQAAGSAAIAGRLPTTEDFIDSAIMVGGFHTAHVASGPILAAIRSHMQANFVQHGWTPDEQAQRARTDPAFRSQLLGTPPPTRQPPPASSTTILDAGRPTPKPGQLRLTDQRAPTPPDQMVLPRRVSSADQAIQFTLQQEGSGLVRDANDAMVKWGINQKDHPNVDLSKMSRADAIEIYKREYWDKINGDALPDNAKLAVFDTSVVEGVGRAREWWAASGGNVQEFLARRVAWEARLARQDPARYGRFVKAWGNRIRALGGSEKLANIVSDDPTSPMTPDKQAMIDALDKEVEYDEHGVGTGSAGNLIGQQQEEDENAVPAVRARMMEDHSNEQGAIDLIGGRGGDGGLPPGSPPPTGGAAGGRGGLPRDQASWEAMDAIHGRPEDPSWTDAVRGTLKDVYLEMFDHDHPFRTLTQAVNKGSPLPDAENPMMLRRLLETSDTSSAYAIDKRLITLDGRETTTPGLKAIMDPNPKASQAKRSADYKDLLRVMTAAWAADKHLKGQKTGVDIDQARTVLQQATPDLVARARQLMDFENGTLLWLYHGEMLSRDDYDRIVDYNSARIPGYRMMDGEKPFSGAKGAANFDPIKAFKGSEKQVQPVYANLQKDTYLRMQIARSNLANLATFKAAESLGQAERREISKPNWDFMRALDQLKDGSVDEDVIDTLAKQAYKAGVVKKDEVPIWEDGKLFAAAFKDPDLVKAMRGYNTFSIGALGKIASFPTRLMKSSIVKTPIFPVKIAAYDLQFQTIINPDGRLAVLKFVEGLGHTLTHDKVWDEWARSGGAEKVFDQMGRDKAIQARIAELHDPHGIAGAFGSGIWNTAKSVPAALQAWSNTIGQIQRVGAYAAARRQGASMTKAAVLSQDAAFHRPGYGGPVSRGLNQLIPFLPAHLNGLEKTTRALLGNTPIAKAVGLTDNRTAAGTPYSATATWMLGAALITLPTLWQQSQLKGQAWYDQIPDWQKGMGFWFHWGGDPNKLEGVTTCIPYPPLVSLIFGEIPRRFAEQFQYDNPHAWDGFWKSFGMALTPPGTETGLSILQPVIEGATNHSFLRDSPIIDDQTRQHVGAAEQYTPYTTETAKAIAQFVDGTPVGAVTGKWAPAIVDNYIKEWSGGLGDQAIRTVEHLTGVADHRGNAAPSWKMDDWMQVWMGGMTSRYPSFSSAPINQFYDTTTKLDQTYGSLKKAVSEDDFDKFKRMVDEEGPTAATYHSLRLQTELPPNVNADRYLDYLDAARDRADQQDVELIHEANTAMANAHQYMRSVYQDKGLSANDKRMILDQTAEIMAQISMAGNDAFDRAHIGVKSAGAAANRPAPDQIQFTPPVELNQ